VSTRAFYKREQTLRLAASDERALVHIHELVKSKRRVAWPSRSSPGGRELL
jgi:hypothetical protein